MKLWLLSQSTKEFNVYTEALVAAETKEEAKKIDPGSGQSTVGIKITSEWPNNPRRIKCQYLGIAKPRTKAGLILSVYRD